MPDEPIWVTSSILHTYEHIWVTSSTLLSVIHLSHISFLLHKFNRFLFHLYLGLVLGLIVINRIMRISINRYLLSIVYNSVVLSIKICICICIYIVNNTFRCKEISFFYVPLMNIATRYVYLFTYRGPHGRYLSKMPQFLLQIPRSYPDFFHRKKIILLMI